MDDAQDEAQDEALWRIGILRNLTPLIARCSIGESLDILRQVDEYLRFHSSHQIPGQEPRMDFSQKWSTKADVSIWQYTAERKRIEIGNIEVTLHSAGCRLRFAGNAREAPTLQGVHHVISNALLDRELLLVENIQPSSQQEELTPKPSPWESTKAKIEELRRLRRESIRNGKVTLGWIKACQRVGIDPETVRGHAPELRKHWNVADREL